MIQSSPCHLEGFWILLLKIHKHWNSVFCFYETKPRQVLPHAEWLRMCTKMTVKLSRTQYRLPRWLSGKEPACHCRRFGFDPCSGKIPHGTTEPVLRAWKPQVLKPVHPRDCALKLEKSLQWEACTPQLESNPHSVQLEKSLPSNIGPVQPEMNK